MKMLPFSEIIFLIGIALVFFVLKRLLSSTTFKNSDGDGGEPPPSYIQEALKDIHSPERSAKLGNIFHKDSNHEI